MATYYGYALKNADSQINWAEVGKNITDMLSEENRIREEKKAAIDEASRQFGKILAEAPQGENQNINGVTLNFANDASQMMLMQDKLLKSGRLKLKDYTIARQNLMDGTSRLFDLTKEWQSVYKEKMDGLKSGELSSTDGDIMAMIEGFGSLENTKIYINPTNGMVSAGKMKRVTIDGKEVDVMDSDANNFNSINELSNFMKQRILKYKVDEALQGEAKMTGTYVDAIMKDPGVQRAGSITSISDPTLRKSFPEYLKGIVTNQLANEYNALSTLKDWVNINPKTGNPYSVSFDKSQQGGDVIYLQKNGQGGWKPILTDEQRKVAEDYLKNKYINMLDREVKKTSIGELSQDTAAIIAEKNKTKRSRTFGEMMGKLISGNVQDKIRASAFFNNLRNAEGGAIGKTLKVEDNGDVFFVDANGRKDPFNIKGDKRTSGMQMLGYYMYPFDLDEKDFESGLMSSGSKNVTFPEKGTRVVVRSGTEKNTTTTNTGTGAGSSGSAADFN